MPGISAYTRISVVRVISDHSFLKINYDCPKWGYDPSQYSLLNAKSFLLIQFSIMPEWKRNLCNEKTYLFTEKINLIEKRRHLTGKKILLLDEKTNLMGKKALLTYKKTFLAGEKTVLTCKKTLLSTEKSHLTGAKTILPG